MIAAGAVVWLKARPATMIDRGYAYQHALALIAIGDEQAEQRPHGRGKRDDSGIEQAGGRGDALR